MEGTFLAGAWRVKKEDSAPGLATRADGPGIELILGSCGLFCGYEAYGA
jgi:hypothetical protein